MLNDVSLWGKHIKKNERWNLPLGSCGKGYKFTWREFLVDRTLALPTCFFQKSDEKKKPSCKYIARTMEGRRTE